MKQKDIDRTGNVARQIKGEIYDSLRKALTAPNGKTKKSWVDGFIEKMLDEAKKNPSGNLGQLLARQLMQEDIISSLDSQTEKLLARDMDFLLFRISLQLYDKQRDVFMDNMIRRKCIMTSRRSGKTELDARLLIASCVKPNSPCVYINLTFDNAIRQCYGLCIDVAKSVELPVRRKSKADGFIEFENGSTIQFKGNHDRDDAEKLRGFKYRLVIIDEAQSQKNMSVLISDVIEPTLTDFADSTLVLTGTPPRIPHTFFQDAFHSKGWKPYNWNMLSNPFIPDAEEAIGRICEAKGLTRESPLIKREYYGLESFDTEAQVFRDALYYDTSNEKEMADFKPTHMVTGCDWGYNDYNSFVTLAYDDLGRGYVIKETKFNKAGVSDIMDKAVEQFVWSREWFVKHGGQDLDNCYLVCDTNESAMIYELQVKRKIPARNAYKYDKDNALSKLAELCRTKIKNISGGVLYDEFSRTVYKRDDDDTILNEVDDDLFHPDAVDALLYASRQYCFDLMFDKEEEEKKIVQPLKPIMNFNDWNEVQQRKVAEAYGEGSVYEGMEVVG